MKKSLSLSENNEMDIKLKNKKDKLKALSGQEKDHRIKYNACLI